MPFCTFCWAQWIHQSASCFEMTAMVAENEREVYDDDNEEGEEDENDEYDEEDGEETELLEAAEMVALSDEFRKSYTDSLF